MLTSISFNIKVDFYGCALKSHGYSACGALGTTETVFVSLGLLVFFSYEFLMPTEIVDREDDVKEDEE